MCFRAKSVEAKGVTLSAQRTHVSAELRRLLSNSVTVVWLFCGGDGRRNMTGGENESIRFFQLSSRFSGLYLNSCVSMCHRPASSPPSLGVVVALEGVPGRPPGVPVDSSCRGPSRLKRTKDFRCPIPRPHNRL